MIAVVIGVGTTILLLVATAVSLWSETAGGVPRVKSPGRG